MPAFPPSIRVRSALLLRPSSIALIAAAFAPFFAPFFAAPAAAQPVVTQDAEPDDTPAMLEAASQSPRLTFAFHAAQQHQFKADLRDTPGSVAVSRTQAGLDLIFAPADLWRVHASIAGEYSHYDFSSGSRIVPAPAANPAWTGDPFDDMYEVSALLRATRFFESGYSLTLGGSIGAAWEEDASLSNSIIGAAYLGVGYQINPRLHIMLGGGVASRLEDDPAFIPVIGINWHITEQVKLSTEGLGLKLTSELNDDFTVGLLGQYQRRQYRLNDRHDNEHIDEGVFRDARAELAFLFAWSPDDRITLEARAGMTLWQEYEIKNHRGSRVSEEDSDPAPFLALSLNIAF